MFLKILYTKILFFQEWPDQDSNPVPEWQIETIDEEPPDIIIDNDMTPNLAFARLQHKQGEKNKNDFFLNMVISKPQKFGNFTKYIFIYFLFQGNTLVDLTQPTVNHTSEAMEVVISDDEPEIIEHHPQQEVQQLQQQQLHPHELSLQDRLRNLAGNISISNSFNLLNKKLNFMSGRRSDVNRVNDWAL